MSYNPVVRDYLDRFIMLLDVILLNDDDILKTAIRPMQKLAEQSPLNLRDTIEFLNHTIAKLQLDEASENGVINRPKYDPHDIVALSYADYLADKQRFISKLAELEMQLIKHEENHK